MSERYANLSGQPPVFPPGRYGRRREPRPRRRWLRGLVVAVAVALATGAAVRLYQQFGDPNYRAQVITYTDITDSQVVVEFRVTLPPGGSAVCLVRARTRDGAEVGREQVQVTAPPGQRQVTVSHRLTTTARPMVGEVPRCWPAE
ncbi:MAG TPA: DUF4307 domain-containing protein [Micromonospora sp.]